MSHQLLSISPVDGRYNKVTSALSDYFSEYALIRYRVRVEVEYFIALCELPLPQLAGVPKSAYDELRKLYTEFTMEDALHVKEIESVTNHDVKAVEYLLKEKLEALGLNAYREFVHFGLTSQDINNTATPLLLEEALRDVYLPALHELVDKIFSLAEQWEDVPTSVTRKSKTAQFRSAREAKAISAQRALTNSSRAHSPTLLQRLSGKHHISRDCPFSGQSFFLFLVLGIQQKIPQRQETFEGFGMQLYFFFSLK